jgi:signal transduction histidine kinase
MPAELTNEELNAIVEVGRTINAHLDLDTVLASVLSVTTTLMRAEASSIVLVDEATGDLLFHVAEGEKAGALKPIRMTAGEGIVGWVIEKGKPAIVNDVASDPRFANRIDDEIGFKTRSILCVPLESNHKVWGALEVLNAVDNRAFGEHDQMICEAIGAQAAIAIENARLHRTIVDNERLTAIGQTIAGLAHCIRNVLNGIHGGSFMVDQGIKKEDPSRTRKGWDIVKKNTVFMKDLVMDMLTYSKDREPEYERCDVNELVEGVCGMIAAKASAGGVTVECETSPDLGEAVLDPNGIRRCLLNLVSNAVDACGSEGNGLVRVTVCADRGDRFRVAITDNGCGIPEEERDKLFKMFYSTKGSKGTGLGLAVTHKIVTEHNGTIAVDSETGRGTAVTVELPVEKQ